MDVHGEDVLLDVPPPGGGEAAEPAGVVLDPVVHGLDVLGQVGLAGGHEVAGVAPVLPAVPEVDLDKIIFDVTRPRRID